MAGIIEVKDQGKLRIYDADNSHYTDIVVPSSVTANRTITLPDASFTVPTSGGVTGITSSANATAMTITSAEKIGIGTGSPVTTLDVGGSLSGGQGVVGKEMLVSQTLNTAYNGGTSGSWGGLMLNNNNSSTSVRTATGLHFTHGTSGVAGIVSTSTTSQRADLRFITRGAGNAVADRVIIHDDGVMSASQGVALGVGTANTASNVLDDYEEGTFTPVWISNVTIGVSSGNYGKYTKIGNLVTLQFGAVLSTSGGTPNYYSINNAPFQSNLPGGYAVGVANEYGQTGDMHYAKIGDNSTTIMLKKYTGTAIINPYIMATITYQTD